MKVVFRPCIIDALRGYTASRFAADLGAGVTVGVVAIPLAIAFAIASGVSPKEGLVTAIVAGFLISALGGSRTQIGGPTGAFIPIVAGIVLGFGYANLLICTFLAGIILLVLGFSGLGKVIKFIPYPVTMGFTSGIAVFILSGEIKNFLGLTVALKPDFIDRVKTYVGAYEQINWTAAALATACLLCLVFWPKRFQKRVPGSIVVLIVASLAVHWFKIDVPTIETMFKGGIPQGLPEFHFPEFSTESLNLLARGAFTIAMLGAIESLLSAVVADSLTNDRHDSNQELMAQGIANMVSPLFGGIPATGAIARTATNIRSGGSTPVAGIIHALVLAAVLVLAAPLAGKIPLCALAAILVLVCYNMGEWHEFKRLHKQPKSDAVVFVIVFALTVLVDLTVAVGIGVTLAALLFIKRVSEMSDVKPLDETHPEGGSRPLWADESWPEGVHLFRIQGAFFFGTADKLETAYRRAGERLRAMVLVLDDVISIDATGLNALESLHERLRKKNCHLVLCRVPKHTMDLLEKSGFIEKLGEANVVQTVEDGLDRARGLIYQRGTEVPVGAS